MNSFTNSKPIMMTTSEREIMRERSRHQIKLKFILNVDKISDLFLMRFDSNMRSRQQSSRNQKRTLKIFIFNETKKSLNQDVPATLGLIDTLFAALLCLICVVYGVSSEYIERQLVRDYLTMVCKRIKCMAGNCVGIYRANE